MKNFNKNIQWAVPIIISNKIITDNNCLVDVDSIDLLDLMLIRMTYKGSKLSYIQHIAKKESTFYNDIYNGDMLTVSFRVPKEKEYMCRIIAKCGYSALNTHLLYKYFFGI